MKIAVDGIDLFELTDIQKQVIQNDVQVEIFDSDMKRRLQWILIHKYEECFRELKNEWDQKLAVNGVTMIPTDPDAYAQLVFSQSNYLNRSARDAQAK
jgi:hypothetical protein